MATTTPSRLDGTALDVWRSYLQSHASILRSLDADLVAEHGMTSRDYEVLLYLSQAPDRMLPMSALAEATMLTRSGITRLIDGLVAAA
jgi:DNA-binding MarR family transcriptional regulator